MESASAERLDESTATALADAVVDPVDFAHAFFADRLWSKQEEMLRAIARPHASVAVKGCHASAKTHAAARAALWFVTRYPDGIVVTTAPKEDQLRLLIWKEIHLALAQARIQYPRALTMELHLAEANYIVSLVAKEATRFQGFHAPHLLFIIEEAPGVAAHIWEAIEGARAGGDVRVLAIGNPTIVGGAFYDAFDQNRRRWAGITISAFDSPNLQGITLEEIQAITDADDPRLARAPFPYLTTRAWVWEKWDEWGRHGHPLWNARVQGLFPDQSPDALIALSWIEVGRLTIGVDDGGEVEAGVDVAGPGEDETVLTVRRGPDVILERWWPNSDPRGELVAALMPYRGRLGRLKVDSAGIGYYLAKHLEDAKLAREVVYVNVGESPKEAEKYKNLKAELYWGLRLRYQAGDVRGMISDETVTQLAGIRWKSNERGQTEIESKEKARKRGVKSPDRAEAMMLAFADITTEDGFLGWLQNTEAKRAAEQKAAVEAAAAQAAR